MGFSVDRRCYEDGGTEPGGRGGGRVFSKGISDSRLSNELSLSLTHSHTVCVCVCVVRPALRPRGEGKQGAYTAAEVWSGGER